MTHRTSRPSGSGSRHGWALAVVTQLALTGCAGTTGTPRFPSVARLPDEPRHAPGVAVDPTPALPATSRRDSADQALVVLSAPVDPQSARDVVRAFFRAVVQERPAKLDALMDKDAWVQTGAQSGHQPALAYWQARLSKYDYTAFSGRLVYRESEMETYRADDLERLHAARALPLVSSINDVLIRVPIVTPRAGRKRLFANEMLFVLGPKDGAYRITGIYEDFRPP